jgi:hypothetical protein
VKKYLNSFYTPCLLVACFFAVLYVAVPPQRIDVFADDPKGEVLDEWALEAFGEADAKELFESLFKLERTEIVKRFDGIDERLDLIEKAKVAALPAVDYESRVAALEKQIQALKAKPKAAVKTGSGSSGVNLPSIYAKKTPVVAQSGGGSSGSKPNATYVLPKTSGTVVTVPVTPAPPVAPVRQWTYPGEIHQHLNQSHGVSGIEGMSTADAEALHSSIHESEVGQAVSVPKAPVVVRSVPVTNYFPQILPNVSRTSTMTRGSSCPGGVCPLPGSVTRSSTVSRGVLFRRR